MVGTALYKEFMWITIYAPSLLAHGGFLRARYLLAVAIIPSMFSRLIQHAHAQANCPIFEAAGGKRHEDYFAVGQNTVWEVAEIPDKVRIEVLTMAVLAGGTVMSIKSPAILTAVEAVAVMKKAHAIAYRPPSS
jgi:uncharacterized protein with GYD domain